MKKNLFVLPLVIFSTVSGQNTNISGVINQYRSISSISSNTLQVSGTSGFLVNDQVLIIQMQGASIQAANNGFYGNITNYNNAGNYEFATIQAILPGAVILSGPLQRSYTPGAALQMVSVPVYQNATVTSTLTCLPWNGDTGGILVFGVCSDLNIQAPIVVSGKGFRGGKVKGGTYTCTGDTLTYFGSSFGPDSMYLAQKGEGIYRTGINDDAGRGKSANGGGGGNDDNGGGAGGANGGNGGRGGDFQSPISCPPNMLTQCGGVAAQALTYNNIQNKLFMGGGGGAGHQNNFTATAGGNGGGLVIIKSRNISGTNQWIYADGNNVTDSISIDGQGGGGAGGSILIDAIFLSGVQLSAKGGYGGSDTYPGWDCHAKGGGGGGGVIWTSNVFTGITTSVTGGAPGLFLASGSPCFNTSLGAGAGQAGFILSGLNLPGTLNPCESIPVAINEFSGTGENLNIYPNPSQGRIYLTQNSIADEGEILVQVYNAIGQLVQSENVHSSSALMQNGLEIHSKGKGLHHLRIKSSTREWSGRFILD